MRILGGKVFRAWLHVARGILVNAEYHNHNPYNGDYNDTITIIDTHAHANLKDRKMKKEFNHPMSKTNTNSKTPSTKNAFHVLLNQQKSIKRPQQNPPQKKKKLLTTNSPCKRKKQHETNFQQGKRASSRFLHCPICNQHVFHDRINSHVDSCIVQSQKNAIPSNIEDNNDSRSTQRRDTTHLKTRSTQNEKAIDEGDQNHNINTNEKLKNDSSNNAFAHLIYSAHQQMVFSKPIKHTTMVNS